MKSCRNTKKIVPVVFILLLVFLTAGCQGLVQGTNSAQPPKQEDPKTRETTAVYYDFDDVLVPKQLSVVKDRTVVVSTPGFTSGIVTLKGMVERTSLFNFFNANMLKDNWSVVSQIKSPGTTIMVFQKATRCAVITIRDEQFNTYVEIGVAPTMSDGTQQNSGFMESTIVE